MRIGPADLDEMARQLRLLNRENIDTRHILINGFSIRVESVEEEDQMGPSKRHYITYIEKPDDGDR